MDEHKPNGERHEAAGAETRETADMVATLQEELARRTEEAERNWQQFLRSAADLENYRKQSLRMREEAVAATRRTMLGVILGVVDNLERALAHAETRTGDAGTGTMTAIVEGMRLAHRQVLDTLKTWNVRPMDAMGQIFDPRVHEAVDAVPAETGTAPGTIVDEVQRGYLTGDEVLRPARVRVAQ